MPESRFREVYPDNGRLCWVEPSAEVDSMDDSVDFAQELGILDYLETEMTFSEF